MCRRDKREEAAEARARFLSREGDHITLLNVFRAYTDVGRKEKVGRRPPSAFLHSWALSCGQGTPTAGQPRRAAAPQAHSSAWFLQVRWCRDNFLNARALRKAADIYEQVRASTGGGGGTAGPSQLWPAGRRQGSSCIVAGRMRLLLSAAALAFHSALATPAAMQLLGHLEALGIPVKSCGDDTTPLRRALTAGLFPHAARRQLDGGSGQELCGTRTGAVVHAQS